MGDERMKEKNVSIAFIRNDSKHGKLQEYLKIPAFVSEYEDVMHRLRMSDVDIEKTEIRIESCGPISNMSWIKVTNASIDELNFFADRVKRLHADQAYAFGAVFAIALENNLYSDGISCKDLINMTYELDNMYVLPGIGSDEELGEILICAQSEEYMENMTDEELEALDSEKVGRECREKENGTYINGAYIAIGKYELPEVYDGIVLPDENYSDYRLGVIRILVTENLTATQTSLSGKEVWIKLPINRAECDRIAHSFGKNSIDECTVCGVRSVIPGIDMNLLSNTTSFEELNKLALAYMNMLSNDKIKFKAIMERESPKDFKTVMALMKDIQEYELDTEVFERGDYTKKYFSKMLPEGFDVDLIKEREYKMIGSRMMHQYDLYRTSYGIISSKGRGLYEMIYKEQEREEKEDIEMGGMQM